MHSDARPDRFPALLAATAMGVYLLLVVGAATAVMEAARACAAWPACVDGFSAPTSLDGWLALGHRLVAVVVGLSLVATGWLGRSAAPDRRTRVALAVALVLYPIQAGLGAAVALGEGALSAVHLLLGLAIFGSLVAALAWTLESLTGDADDAPDSPPERDLPLVSEAESPPVPTDRVERLKATARAYFRMTKPRLMWLLCLVAAAAMALAGGPGLNPWTIGATLGGGALAIGASGTFNHVLERDVDRRMQRTSDRPLAVDLVPVRNAVAFGLTLAAISLALFASVNLLAAVLGLAAIVFYSVVYTLVLKPNTVQNTVIGGAAGALPALIGWAAVTGSIGAAGLGLAVLIFMWTPAHFYNLALAYKEDYARGGFPMMPVVRGETATRRHILWYLGATYGVAALLAAAEGLGWLYLVAGVGVGAVFLWTVVRLHYEQTEEAAFRAFHASNAYLGAVLLAVVVDSLAV